MSKVTLRGHIVIPEADHDAVVAALPEHIALTRGEPGCEIFEVTPDESRPGRYAIHEVFTDADAFRAHQARMKGSPWGAITARVERQYTVTGLPANPHLQPRAIADWLIALALNLSAIALVYVVIVVSFDPLDYLASVAEVLAAPFYPGVFLYWPPLAALALLAIHWLGLTRISARKRRLPLFLLSDCCWIGVGLGVIVLWYG